MILRATTLESDAEIYLLEMGSPIKIADLARNMIELSGLTPGEDIAIEYIGLRPGEKLHEALVNPEEKLQATGDPDLKILQGSALATDLAPRIAALEAALGRGSLPEIFDQLIAIVPDYQPSALIRERIAQARIAEESKPEGAARVRPVLGRDSHLHVV